MRQAAAGLAEAAALPLRAFRRVVAIPARDEEETIGRCLSAIVADRPRDTAIVVVADMCSDATAEVARAIARTQRVPIVVLERLAGGRATAPDARRLAMDCAAAFCRSNGVILTTDADSVPERHWVTRLAGRLVDARLAALAGAIRYTRLPPAAEARVEAGRQMEMEHRRLLRSLAASIDAAAPPWPEPFPPSGANLAVSAAAYGAIGGLPMPAAGEDRALFRAVKRAGLATGHAPDIVVETSSRVAGRAAGGAAETLRSVLGGDDGVAASDWILSPDGVADGAIARRRLRTARSLRAREDALAGLSLPAAAQQRIARAPTSEAAWRQAEVEAPVLAARRLTRGELLDEVAALRARLAAAGGS